MITVYKSRIALAICLLLAQNAHGFGQLNFPTIKELSKELCGYLIASSGFLLSCDGMVDLSYQSRRAAVPEKRNQLVEDGLRLTPEIGRAELTRHAALVVPDSVPTAPKVRVLKFISGVVLMIGGIWLSNQK